MCKAKHIPICIYIYRGGFSFSSDRKRKFILNTVTAVCCIIMYIYTRGVDGGNNFSFFSTHNFTFLSFWHHPFIYTHSSQPHHTIYTASILCTFAHTTRNIFLSNDLQYHFFVFSSMIFHIFIPSCFSLSLCLSVSISFHAHLRTHNVHTLFYILCVKILKLRHFFTTLKSEKKRNRYVCVRFLRFKWNLVVRIMYMLFLFPFGMYGMFSFFSFKVFFFVSLQVLVFFSFRLQTRSMKATLKREIKK